MASSKLRQASSAEDENCALDMSPMIDCVFLLLIFFIVNASAIIVKTDPNVKPPIAANAMKQKTKDGRIVINIREDGTYTAEDFNVILPDEVAIFDLVDKERQKIEQLGQKPKLHLRGDKDTVFKYSRTAIRAAAKAKVSEVVFAVFVKQP